MTRAYTPRRANARWLEGAPEYVLSCHDDGGKTIDRYTVYIGGTLHEPGTREVSYLAMSGAPTHPQGFSQWGEHAGCHRVPGRVRWLDLPENIREHVKARCQHVATETAKGVAA
jgi:hypothetical protein